MSSPLFRPQALAFHTQGAPASPLQTRHPFLRILVIAIVLASLSLIAFFMFNHYTRRASAPGLLQPVAGMVRVYPPRAGTLVGLRVREGDRVAAGAVLAHLHSERGLEGALLAEVGQQQGHVLANSQTGAARLRLDLDRLAERETALGRELQQLQGQMTLQQTRLRLAEQKLTAMSQMHGSGFISARGLAEHEEAVLAQRQTEMDLQRQRERLTLELRQLQQDKQSTEFTAAQEQRRIASSQSDLRQKALQLADQNASELRAPISGRVTAIQAQAGERVEGQRPILAILPEGGPLVAELLLPSRAIGFVRVGQPVRLMVEAFPYQRFGLIPGEVVAVAQTVLAPQELKSPLQVNEPVYPVTVRLLRNSVRAYGQAQPLRAGMTVRADIVVDRRPLWQWLLEPIIAVRGRMLD